MHKRSSDLEGILSAVAVAEPLQLTLGRARNPRRWYKLDCRPLQNLRVLHLCDVTLVTWYHLAGLPHLTEAYVTETKRGSSDCALEDENHDFVTFPSLQILQLECTHLFTVAIQKTAMPLLQDITGGNLSKGQEPVVALAERSVQLEEMTIEFDCKTITPRTIECLSDLENLRIIRLGGVVDSIEVNDEALGTLARSLPMLRHFSLAMVHAADNKTICITVTTFLSFVQSSTVLETLELPLNLTSFDTLHTSSYASYVTPSHSIVDFTICQLVLPSRIYDAANFLAKYCPGVLDLKLRDMEKRGAVMESWVVRGRKSLVAEFKAHQAGRLKWSDEQ